MSDKVYDIPAEWKQRGFINEAKYDEMYQRSVKDPNGFWGEQGPSGGYDVLVPEELYLSVLADELSRARFERAAASVRALGGDRPVG